MLDSYAYKTNIKVSMKGKIWYNSYYWTCEQLDLQNHLMGGLKVESYNSEEVSFTILHSQAIHQI